MIYHVWMIPQQWTPITHGFFFQSLTAASCHSARRACPELQNPLFQKAKENLLPGDKGPVSGRMRDDEKGHFHEPYLTSKKDASVPEVEGYSWDDGFCDFAIRLRAEWQHWWGCLRIKWKKRRFQSCTWGSDTNHLALPCCAPVAYKGFG